MGKDTFDLVFLDVRLPDGEGTDWLKELNCARNGRWSSS